MVPTYVSLPASTKDFQISIQEKEMKECLLCQDRVLSHSPSSHEEDDFKRSYACRSDILEIEVKTQEMDFSGRKAIFVRHVPNHPDCYNYTLSMFPFLYEEQSREESPISQITRHQCPGHKVLIDKFISEDHAKTVGEEEKTRRLQSPNIKEAYFKLVTRSSQEAKNHQYFAAIGINKFALIAIYYHHDNSKLCPDHPNYTPIEGGVPTLYTRP